MSIRENLTRINPVIKLVYAVFLVTLISFTSSENMMFIAVIACAVIAFFIVVRIKINLLWQRIKLLLPFLFIFFISTLFNQYFPLFALLKAAVSISVMLALVISTPFDSIQSALKTLKFPEFVIAILTFFHFFLLYAQKRLFYSFLGIKARTPGTNKYGLWRGLALNIGKLMLLSFEKAERINMSIKARGGLNHLNIKATKVTPLEIAGLALFIIITLIARFRLC